MRNAVKTWKTEERKRKRRTVTKKLTVVNDCQRSRPNKNMNKCVVIVTHSNDLAKQADVIMKLRKGDLLTFSIGRRKFQHLTKEKASPIRNTVEYKTEAIEGQDSRNAWNSKINVV